MTGNFLFAVNSENVFLSLPKDVHVYSIAQFLEGAQLFRVGLACRELLYAQWYSFTALPELSGRLPNALTSNISHWVANGGRLAALRRLEGWYKLPAAQSLQIVQATIPSKLTTLSLEMTEHSAGPYLEMLRLLSPWLRCLSLSGTFKSDILLEVLKVPIEYSELRHLDISWDNRTPFQLLNAPKLEVLEVCALTLEQLTGLKQASNLKYIRCRGSGPFESVYDREVFDISSASATIDFVRPAVEHVKKLCPPSVGINVWMTLVTNTGGYYPGWGETEASILSIAADTGAGRSTLEYLYKEGADLSFIPSNIFLNCRDGNSSTLHRVGRGISATDNPSDPYLSAYQYLMEHPAYCFSIFEDGFLRASLKAEPKFVWEAVVGENAKYAKLSLARSFGQHSVSLLADLLSSSEPPSMLELLKWLHQPALREFFVLDGTTQSVFQVGTSSCAYKKDILLFLRDELKVHPNLVVCRPCRKETTIEYLLGQTYGSFEAMNNLVAVFGADAFKTTETNLSIQAQGIAASSLTTQSAFATQRPVYCWSREAMLAISNTISIAPLLQAYADWNGEHRLEERAWQREALLFLLRGGGVKPSTRTQMLVSTLEDLVRQYIVVDNTRELATEISSLAYKLLV